MFQKTNQKELLYYKKVILRFGEKKTHHFCTNTPCVNLKIIFFLTAPYTAKWLEALVHYVV